jgi:hypothetical protein
MPKRKLEDDDYDERGILKDGHRIRVPFMLRDHDPTHVEAVRILRDAFGTYPPGPGTKEGGACTIDGAPGHLVKQSDGTFLCVPDDETEDHMTKKDDASTVVCDALGRSDPISLAQPGSRYLRSGAHTVDHTVQVTRRHMRDKALADSIEEMNDAWKGTGNTREVARTHHTNDAIADAYMDQLDDLQNAWDTHRTRQR